jgi:hypothetical protein
MAFNVTLTGAPQQPPASSGTADMDISAVLARGFVYSNTPQKGGASLDAMANVSYSNTTSVRFAVNGTGPNATLSLTLPDFYMSFLGETQGVNPPGKPFAGPWTGTLLMVFQGNVTLSGALGCPLNCGAWGRCRMVGSSAACECECGWEVSNTTGACDRPQGSCPAFTSDLLTGGTRNFTLVTLTGGAGAGGDSSSALGQGGTCATGYGYDMVSKTCSKCPPGFSGAGCKACLADDSCRGTTPGAPNAICASGLAYAARTTAKHYACRPSSDDIVQVGGGEGGRGAWGEGVCVTQVTQQRDAAKIGGCMKHLMTAHGNRRLVAQMAFGCRHVHHVVFPMACPPPPFLP